MSTTLRQWIAASPSRTLELGAAVGAAMPGGCVLGLVGPLGAGKTLFVKGIARGLGVEDPARVVSPTFTLVNEYTGRLRLYHLDTYRLRGPRDVLALGYSEMIRDDAAVLIEWADRVREILPQETLWFTLEPLDDARRRIRVEAAADSTWLSAIAIDTPSTTN